MPLPQLVQKRMLIYCSLVTLGGNRPREKSLLFSLWRLLEVRFLALPDFQHPAEKNVFRSQPADDASHRATTKITMHVASEQFQPFACFSLADGVV